MDSVRDAKNAALLVVDAQKGVIAAAHERDAVLRNINAMIRKARAAGVPVVWIQHGDDELPVGGEAWRLDPSLEQDPADHYLQKRFNSSFEETSLETLLLGLRVGTIVLAGAATNWCIRATAFGALDRGFDLTLISDAHTTESIVYRDGRVISARDLIDELNISMAHLSYPGRRNRSVPAAAFEF